MEIVILGPHEVSIEDYKNLRLEALRKEPQAFGQSYKDHKNLPNEKWQENLENYKKGENNWMVFAGEDGKLVGMIGAFIKDDNDIVDVIATYVTKEKRGQGISKKLMNQLISLIREKTAAQKLRLGVTAIQIPAFNLYKSLGFTVVKEEQQKLGDGNTYKVYIMEKEI